MLTSGCAFFFLTILMVVHLFTFDGIMFFSIVGYNIILFRPQHLSPMGARSSTALALDSFTTFPILDTTHDSAKCQLALAEILLVLGEHTRKTTIDTYSIVHNASGTNKVLCKYSSSQGPPFGQYTRAWGGRGHRPGGGSSLPSSSKVEIGMAAVAIIVGQW